MGQSPDVIHMVARQQFGGILIGRSAAVRALAIAFLSFLSLAGCSRNQSIAKASSCATNMTAIWFELRSWNWNGASFPASLNSLPPTNDAALFVCPSSNHPPGAMNKVSEWTDYIYVNSSRVSDSMMLDVALLICPPENHNGEFGHVLLGNGQVVRLPPDKVRALIKEPWGMPTSTRNSLTIYDSSGAPVPFAAHMHTNLSVQIPSRFRSVYGDGDKSIELANPVTPMSMIAKEIEAIFAGQEAEDGDVDVDGVLEAFDRLKSMATESDLPALIAAIQSPRNNFWTRELLAEPICRLGGSDYLEPLLEAVQLGSDEGHDNDGFNTSLIEIAHAEPERCRAMIEELLARLNFKHQMKARWLLEFCK